MDAKQRKSKAEYASLPKEKQRPTPWNSQRAGWMNEWVDFNRSRPQSPPERKLSSPTGSIHTFFF
jgi:hypothetical protein